MKKGYNASCKINNKVDNTFLNSNVHLIIYYSSEILYSANLLVYFDSVIFDIESLFYSTFRLYRLRGISASAFIPPFLFLTAKVRINLESTKFFSPYPSLMVIFLYFEF